MEENKAYSFTIGQEFNDWIVDNVVERKNEKGKKYYFLESHCKHCNKQKLLRADKRNSYAKCTCVENQKKYHDKLWEKVKITNLFNSKEEFLNKYSEEELEKLNVYKIKKNYKTSYFLGTKEEYEAIKFPNDNISKTPINVMGRKCPVCGKYYIYLNKCEHCNTVFDEQFYSKNEINYENSCYTENNNYLSVIDEYGEKIYFPIDLIKAKYVKNKNTNEITRIGLTRINSIDYKHQGIIGDFQGIDKNGKTFIIENVFQPFNNDRKMFRLIIKRESKTFNVDDDIPYIEEQDYFYFVLKRDSIPYSLYIYKNDKCIYIIKHIVDFWGMNFHRQYIKIGYENIDQTVYKFSTNTEKIDKDDDAVLPKQDLSQKPNIISEKYLRNKDKIPIYINKRHYKSSECMFYFLNKFDNFKRIDNEFDDDNTENYIAEVDSQNFKDLDFIYYLYLKKTDPLTFFGNSLNIYGYPLFRIMREIIYQNLEQLKKDFKIYNELWKICEYVKADFSRNQNEYDFIIKKLTTKYNCNEYDLLKIMINKYGIIEILNLNYYYAQKRVYNVNSKLFLEKENILIKYNNIDKIKWKSEYTMFELISFYYKDAIYQCNINGMVFDVYIPSINVAFEYQGEGHYKSIKQFGGAEKFKDLQIRDSLKKEYCVQNNITLIEWRYDELINKIILDKKLKEFKIV